MTATQEKQKRDQNRNEKLSSDQALAKRWLRSRFAPLEVWQWLAGAAQHAKAPVWVAPPELDRLLSAIGEPLARQSNAHERAALTRDLSRAASLLAFIHIKSRGAALACQERMLAACLLPLYRGLAQGSIEEVIFVMRRQLAEALTLAALLSEFELELPELLSSAMSQDKAPHEVLAKTLCIELDQVAQRLVSAGYGWSGSDEAELHACICSELKIEQPPSWGAKQTLWRLAGELISERSEFVVPRDWVHVPVPWNDANQHWREIVNALNNCEGLVASSTSTSAEPSSNPEKTSVRKVSSAVQPAVEAMDDVARLKLEIEIANSVDALVQSSRKAARSTGPTSASRAAQNRTLADEFVIPKVIIAEIRSHNDPAFIAVVRRQLAMCRSNERTVSLVAARVQPDDDCLPDDGSDAPTLKSLGLATWQQKLVNWMADHPEVNDPYAFISSQGELILCLMDIERNTATILLRQGLVKVLTGQTLEGDAAATLARVEIPARFHSGIASVSAPTASFEPEQLIEATYRCLAAAERHGKASIKSIEVF